MSPLMGITPIMDWVRKHYGKDYAANTRETFRRQTMHQFQAAGLVLYNPDNPKRAVNSPKAVYQIEPKALELLQKYGTQSWMSGLQAYTRNRPSLVETYAKQRSLNQTSVQLPKGGNLNLTPGDHSTLVKAIIDLFVLRFIPSADLIYVGDTGKKWAYFDKSKLQSLGIRLDPHGKMPDLVLFDSERKWIILIEAVTTHGPVDGKRHNELASLFEATQVGLVFVTAFHSRAILAKYVTQIAWETEVWSADAPDHLIHFNGKRFLGPY